MLGSKDSRGARGSPAMAEPSGIALASAGVPVADRDVAHSRRIGAAHRRQRARRTQAHAERHAEIRGAILARQPHTRFQLDDFRRGRRGI